MLIRFCFYLIGHHLLWLAAFWLYGRWVERDGGYRWKSVAGLILGFACIGTEWLPWCLPAVPGGELLHRQAGFLLGLAVFGGQGVLVLTGILRLGSQLMQANCLGHCTTEQGWCENPGPGLQTRFHQALSRLRRVQAMIEEKLGYPVPFMLTESCLKPCLTGPDPHRIQVPFVLAEAGVDLEGQLLPLARWAGGKRFRAFLWLWWVSQLHLLTLPLARRIWFALEAERERELAGATAGTAGLSSWPFWVAPAGIMLGGVCMGAAWAGIDAAEGIAILTRTQIIGYSANGPDPSTRFRAIPGEGGILPDGLRVDTTRTSPRACCATVRFPLGLFDHEKWVPFGAKALKIQLKWRVRARRPWAKALPAWRVDANEHGPVDQDGQQHLRTFWGRNVLLAEHGRLEGVLELAIHLQPAVRTLPGSKDVLFGPLALIPAGWDIEFRGYDVTPVAPSQVSDPPIGELARYEAWYLEHEDKPSAIDLRWRAPGMRP